jgi:opacity protein-like surface antigen
MQVFPWRRPEGFALDVGTFSPSTESRITFFTIDVNVLYPFQAGETFAPYVGAGLGHTDVSVDVETRFGDVSGDVSDTGLNLVGGANSKRGGSLSPFVKGRLTVGGDLDRFGLTGGVLFAL